MGCQAQDILSESTRQLPLWFRQKIPDIKKIRRMQERFRVSRLHTVCESALCPNMGQCWGQGVATFMILGDVCTRGCRFCAVKAGVPLTVNKNEPREVALAVAKLDLNYVVITSVTRDDLDEGGAGQFANTVKAIRKVSPKTKIELLIPDFLNDLENLEKVIAVNPEVIGHNMETVRRLSPAIRPQADYDRSLKVLKNIKQLAPDVLTKSGIMVGLGERDEEVVETMKDLILVGCDILTVGQYLAPTQLNRHVKVHRFVTPKEFENYRKMGTELGFKHVMSGPLVRSSYIAEEGYKESMGKRHVLKI